MEPNLIKCEVQKHQRYLTEQELAELKRASQEAAVFFKAYFREKYATDCSAALKTQKTKNARRSA